ncbi:PA0069 family radical SAM protein [Rubellicoccus peritrichatus]|uniref:PA0069 family radical SAM protein n=1 Tax=Rubellicoccus peritrichatus TaxID=3080537 RepID=A0AAQ3L5M1_9BACT|nr:PA0069 family radical SAM protein [Puniceicoccus sp. CR14]WOO39635.1 PA0069 family radical SAM protein [Puniceicoccus sp. CR14]
MQPSKPTPPRGRGIASNPRNRFEQTEYIPEPDSGIHDPNNKVQTRYFEDHTSDIISRNNSPDIPFSVGVNPYRGCEHGCVYCYARPTHEYLGFSSGLDFETKIMFKPKAPELLRKALGSRRWKPEPIAMSGVTDPYQPVERSLKITRGCLEVICAARQPVALITKNALIQRDIDLLAELAKWQCVVVNISITTLDSRLGRLMEPRTASPRQRLETVSKLRAAEIPVGVMIAPVIPGLNDEEIPSIIESAASAGALWFNTVPIRLPYSVKDVFRDWLQLNFPNKYEKIVSRIKDMRGGKLNDPNLRSRMRGEGIWPEQIKALRLLGLRRAKVVPYKATLTSEHFQPPESNGQMRMNFM